MSADQLLDSCHAALEAWLSEHKEDSRLDSVYSFSKG